MPHMYSGDLQSRAALAGAIALAVAAAAIVSALAFEHIGGYVPCPLCLQQRYAYYAGIPALALALALLWTGNTTAARIVFALVALAFLVNAGLGVYQAGAEWKFWEPPASCAAPSSLPTFDIKQQSFDRLPVSCGAASWRFLGLSFAGWNAVASLFVSAMAGIALLTPNRVRVAVHGASG